MKNRLKCPASWATVRRMPRVKRSQIPAEVLESVFDRLAAGETLIEICACKGMPSQKTIYRLLEENAELRQKYAQARAKQADTFAEQIVAESRKAKDAQLGRLRMDALKWAASKIAPKKYGDRVELEHSGDQPAIIVKIGDAIVPPGQPPKNG